MFEGVKNVAEKIKQGAKEMREAFMQKFEKSKKELAEKVLGAKSPEDMIALGKKLQEQGETLQRENQEVQKEEDFEKEGNLAEEELAVAGNNERISESIDRGEKVAAQDTTEKQVAWEEEKRTTAEYAQKSKQSDETKKAEILAKLGLEKAETAPMEKTEAVVTEKTEPAKEGPAIDPVEVNNRIMNIPEHKRQVAIDNLTPDEIQAVVKDIAKGDWESTLSFLGNFRNKTEIVSSPEMTNKFKEVLSSGRVHVYDIDRIQSLPGISNEIFNDESVKKGVKNSIKSFVVNIRSSDWPHVTNIINKVVERANIGTSDLRDIAEDIKADTEPYMRFIQHFGAKRIYPEL